MAERQLRPLSLGDVFDEAFDLYKKNLAFLALVTAVTAVPLKIVMTVVTFRVLRDFLGIAGTLDDSDPTRLFSWLLSLAGNAALFAPIYLVAYGVEMSALAVATSARYLGQPVTLWGAYRVPLRRLLPLIVTAILYGVANALGLIGCYVAIVVPLTLFVFTAHAFALENQSYFKALGRSAGLMSGDALRVFGALFLLGLLSFVISIALQLPLIYGLDLLLRLTPAAQGLLGAGAGALHGLSLRDQIVEQVTGGFVEVILTPFLLSVLTVLYYDLRVRKEAFDIELLARNLGYAPLVLQPTVFPPVGPPSGRPLPARGARGPSQ